MEGVALAHALGLTLADGEGDGFSEVVAVQPPIAVASATRMQLRLTAPAKVPLGTHIRRGRRSRHARPAGGAFGPEAARIVVALADHAPAGVEIAVLAGDELQRAGEVVIDGRTEGHLGLGYERALDAVDCSAWPADRLAPLFNAGSSGSLFPLAADPFFRAQRIEASALLTPGYSILVVIDGAGNLRTHAGAPMALARGDTVLIPFAAGETRLEGDLEAIRCLPPAPVPD